MQTKTLLLSSSSTLRTVAAAWLRHLHHLATQVPPALSAETLRRYRSALVHIDDRACSAEGQHFVLGDLSLDEITTPLVDDWLASVRPNGWHGGRVAENTFRVVRNLLYWARRRGIIRDNPAAHLRLRERPTAGRPVDAESLVRYEEALRELGMGAAQRAAGRAELARLGASSAARVLLLILETGLRVEEAARAEVEGFRPAERLLVLRWTKGGRPRHVALGSGAVELLEEQLRHVGSRSAWLFPSPVIPGAPIRHGAVWDTHHRACVAAELRRRFRPHDLRHQFVTDALRRGHAHKAVGLVVGHTAERTTRRYDHLVVHPVEHDIVDDLHEARQQARARFGRGVQ